MRTRFSRTPLVVALLVLGIVWAGNARASERQSSGEEVEKSGGVMHAVEEDWMKLKHAVGGAERWVEWKSRRALRNLREGLHEHFGAGLDHLKEALEKEETEARQWVDETLDVIERSEGRVMVDMETGLLRLTQDVERDVDREYERLRRDLAGALESADALVDRIGHEVEHAAVDVAEDGLSAARSILRDLARHSPPPVAVRTVPPIDSALSDVALPMQIDSFPQRPPPLLELGEAFYGEGYINPGFRFLTGTMIQPQFFLYGLFRTGIQTFDNGVDPRVTQWVNSLQLFANFNATPTERLLVEFRPLDNTSDFSGYNFEPTTGPDSGWQNALNGRLYQLFFEGNFLSIFPGLDTGRGYALDFNFSVGRQQVSLQSGVLLNDSIDMIGITYPSLFWFGSSAATASLFYVWGNIHRSNGFLTPTAQLIGGYWRGDYLTSTIEFDLFYGTASRSEGGDGFYFAASSVQRIGKINTNFTGAASVALNPYNPQETGLDTGGLLFVQLSTDVPRTEDILYLNLFWAIENFTSASRAADAGGPLGQTGLLFAATGLGDFGAALGSSASNSAGGALGYQFIFGDLYRRQLTFEVGAQTQTVGVSQQSVAAGVQYSQAFGQRWTWTVGTIGALQRDLGPLYGLRMELDFSF